MSAEAIDVTPPAPPARPVPIAPHWAGIPAELRELPQWVGWQYRLTDKGKWTKVPCRAIDASRGASSMESRTWAPFDLARAAYDREGLDGVGFVTSTSDPYVLIDLDHVVDPATGEMAAWARPILEAARREHAYVEVSPSGTGFHIIGRGRQFTEGKKKRHDAEMYCVGRFFTITGDSEELAGAIGEIPETMELVRLRMAGEPAKEQPRPSGAPDSGAGNATDAELIERARRAKNGAEFAALYDGTVPADGRSEADFRLAAMLRFWTGGDAGRIERIMLTSGLRREKWGTMRGDLTYLQYTIAKALELGGEVYTGRSPRGAAEDASAGQTTAAEGEAGTEPEPPIGGVSDFYAYMPMHMYIFVPSRELWPAASVNARCAPPVHDDGTPATRKVARKGKGGELEFDDVPLSPAEYVDKFRPVDQMTWAPGEPLIVRDRLVSNGGWIDRDGAACFNQYRPPARLVGDSDKALPWVEHVHRVFGASADRIILWLAHRVQRPGEKINHALVLGGAQGIGKDTLLEPVKAAIGAWNFSEVSPTQLMGRFNGFVKSVILRVSEARDLGDVDRYAFYDHMKVYTAAPPDVLRCDEKHLREHAVMNVCGVIITSNHKADGIYLPADDRRHYVAWSECTKESFDAAYWNGLWRWYQDGGTGHVAAYLADLDLRNFDPKAPPPKTPAFWDIADANRAPEDAELADAIDAAGRPAAITLTAITDRAGDSFREWLQDRRNRRQVPYRLEAAGYVPVRNDGAQDGLWVVYGRRQAIYGRSDLLPRDRIAAAAEIARRKAT